ncbi:MAG TPA: hypothetical protein VI727_04070 [Candidatus Brocadiaceae bacterium]|nr:hypothetical protein [Candidatus Brocadiaceae bacterium]
MKPIELIFPGHQAKIDAGICTTCGGKVGAMRDELSRKEVRISGMCQDCQDRVFGSEE